MQLDRSRPAPLYHQIAQALKYQIATGALRADSRLPSLKDAAVQWGVNLHTVRRAYHELAKEGLVRTRTPGGTRVLPAAAVPGEAPTGGAALRAFIDGVKQTALQEHGLSPSEVVALLTRWRRPEPPCRRISVVECSLSQSSDLCRQVGALWEVRALPFDLGRPGAPPPGPVLGTYFHFNGIRRRWPDRIGDLHFVAIRPDPALEFSLWSGKGRRQLVILVEREATMAANIETDLRALLPRQLELRVEISSDPRGVLQTLPSGAAVLFSPRMWGELSDTERGAPRACEARYVIDGHDLQTVANELGWEARSPVRNAG